MQQEKEQALRDELVQVRRSHRELDEQIVAAEASGTMDQLQIRRLKKQKLALRDRVEAIEDLLTPDIIA